jgi:hypothetical protein
VNFILKIVKRDKEDHFMLIKAAIHEQKIIIINLYVPNVSAPNFIKHTLKDLKVHKDSNTVVVRDFNLSSIDRSSSQKFSKENLDQMIPQIQWT